MNVKMKLVILIILVIASLISVLKTGDYLKERMRK